MEDPQDRDFEEQELQREQAAQFRQQTNHLKQQFKRKLKQKAKAVAKEQIKKKIKKKVAQRIVVWLAAAISPEVLLIIAIVIIAIIVIIIIIVYACDIPGISVAIGLFAPEEFAGICDSVAGSVGNSDIESVPLPTGLLHGH